MNINLTKVVIEIVAHYTASIFDLHMVDIPHTINIGCTYTHTYIENIQEGKGKRDTGGKKEKSISAVDVVVGIWYIILVSLDHTTCRLHGSQNNSNDSNYWSSLH
jgi:hypothetical protein